MPAAQREHTDDPGVAAKRPGWQAVQLVAPDVAAKFPAAQGVHADAPGAAAKLPG